MGSNLENSILSKNNFLFLKKTSLKYSGIELTDLKIDILYNNLFKRLKTLNLTSFDEYCDFLRTDRENEIQKFINLITNLSTNFFRENHHFEYLKEKALPSILSHRRKIHILSAGCSTGEEPYSIAIVIKEIIKNVMSYDIKILAIDINSEALEIAKKGIYPISSIDNLENERKKMWFTKGVNRNNGLVKINDELRRMISFSQLNLPSAAYKHGIFDIIFCRNVIIYFNEETKVNVLERLDYSLKQKGFLFLGHSETLRDLRSRYERVEKSTYKKIKDTFHTEKLKK